MMNAVILYDKLYKHPKVVQPEKIPAVHCSTYEFLWSKLGPGEVLLFDEMMVKR
jgi:hypothetical protein